MTTTIRQLRIFLSFVLICLAASASAANVMPVWRNDTTTNTMSFNDTFGHQVSIGTYDSITGLWTLIPGSISVGQTFTGGLISVAGSPVTGFGTLALTVAGTSGGIPYFSSATAWASSAALGANQLVLGGGAGLAPSTPITLGTVTQVLHGNAAGAPSFGAIVSADVSAVLAAPPPIGITTPNTGAFTTLGATGLSSVFSINATSNVRITGGSQTIVDLFTAPPTHGIFLSNAGPSYAICPIIGCLAGDTRRTSLYIKNATTLSPEIAEYMVQIDTTANTGKAPRWTASTSYVAGDYVANGVNVYKQTVSSCTSAASGGPTGTGTGIVDNTCLWDFKVTTHTASKLGIINALIVGPLGPFSVWNGASNMVIQSGWTGAFAVNHEFDSQNGSTDCAVGSGKACYNVLIGGTVINPLTALLSMSSSSSTGPFAAHFGILIPADPFVADTADIEISSSAPVALSIGGLGAPTHSIAAVRDKTTSPIGVSLHEGTHSTAAITIKSGEKVCYNGTSDCTLFTGGKVVPPASFEYRDTIGGGSGASLAAGTTNFFVSTSGTAGNTRANLAARSGTFKNLRVQQNAAPGGSETAIYTLRVNNADTAITCTITGAATTCSDLTNTAAITTAQSYEMKSVFSASANAAIPLFGIELLN